ncbi:MAG: hypothetical protein KBC98_01605 [Candidatus Pacebacteria bacterium]|nr:hypothetical protein [Candidatus Paceibacterota bacterium]
MMNPKQKTYSLLLLALGGACILFLGIFTWRIAGALEGPNLHIAGVEDGQLLESPLISLSGSSPHSRTISVNGKILPSATDGAFTDTLLLHPGFNILVVEAEDERGRKTHSTYSLVLHEEGIASYAISNVRKHNN